MLLTFGHRDYIIPAFFLGFLLFLGLPFTDAEAQNTNGKNEVIVIGQVTAKANGAPVKFQAVSILSDTTYEPLLIYSNTVITDQDGFFYDTISTETIKGAFNIWTYDYEGNRHDTTVYFRFNWDETIYLFTNFVVPLKPGTTTYQANFYYVRNPYGQNLKEYQFYDLTNAPNIISWEWDFGDGQYSNLQNPVHIYAQPGVYWVTLTTKIQNSAFGKPIVSKILKVIEVTIQSYFHLGGHVFAGYFPIDKGEAYLYKIEEDGLTLIDTAIFSDSLGFYVFFQLIEGNYIVKADLDPSSTLFNEFMTTYYSDKLHWYEADTIFLHETQFEYDIHLAQNNKMMAGTGVLGGNINYSLGNNEMLIPAYNITILLYNDSGQPIDICHSEADGTFLLDQIEPGTYYLHAEVTGMNTYPLYVELSDENMEITKIELTISQNGVTGSIGSTGISENGMNTYISYPYPNPAPESVGFDLDLMQPETLYYAVFDYCGRQVIALQPVILDASPTLVIQTGNLAAGTYFVHFRTAEGFHVTRKFIR